MKRIINKISIVIALSSIAFTLNSCQDALDISQPGELQEQNLYTSVSNLNEVLNGSIYAQLDPADEIYFTAVFTDEVKPGKGSGGQEYGLHRNFLDPSDGLVNGIWLNNYTVINRVNRLLEGAKKITPANNDELKKYNSILAQARAIRAYCYVQLEAYFSPDMKSSDALGVILVKDIPATDAKLPRSKNQEIYDFINADLDYARSILEYSLATTPGNRYYVDKGFVNAVSARFNLYRGNMALAKQYAQDVITNSNLVLTIADPIKPAGDNPPNIGDPAWNNAFYGVTSSFNPYRNLWNDSSRGEIIFSLNRLPLGAGSSIGSRWNTNRSDASGSPMWFWGRNLYNIFQNIPGDIRKYSYVDPTSAPKANYLNSVGSDATRDDMLVVDKYPGKTSAPIRNDIKVFRLSEIYFILAEAEVATGNLSTARDLIHKVRVARNYLGVAVTPNYTNAEFAYADILKERRVELALEGHRYLDLKRLAEAADVMMDRNVTDDVVTVSNLPNNSHKYTLPIPISEVSANSNIQQNQGY